MSLEQIMYYVCQCSSSSVTDAAAALGSLDSRAVINYSRSPDSAIDQIAALWKRS